MPARRATKRANDARKSTDRYDAAGLGRRIARWLPPANGPQKAVEGSARLLNRARDAVRNDWAAESSTAKWTSTLVGTGIQPRWKNVDIRAVWDDWGREADADGVLDIYGMQALATRSWLEAGEVFLRRRPRAIESPLSVPVQVQIIESEFCPMMDTDTWPGMPIGHTMRQGIERNRFGRRTAYWLYREHPGDKPMRATTNDLVRVAASDIAHVFEPKRPGQLRGVSPLAPILLRLRSNADYEDAVLERQKLANLFTMFITRSLPDNWDGEVDENGLPKFYNADGVQMVGLEPGISQQLQPGEDVKFANPPEAGTTYSDYVRSQGLGTAAGQNMPYEFMSGDIKDISDRTLRIVVQEFRRFASQRQWHTLIPMACQRTVEWFADAAALGGRLSLAQLPEARRPEWAPNMWEYIHPVQDAQGKRLLLEMGAISKTQIISDRGDDAEKVFQQRSDDKKREDELGLTPPEPVAAAPGKTPQATLRSDDEMRSFIDAQLARTQAPQMTVADVRAAVAAEMAAQQPRTTEIHNHLPAPQVHNHVAAADVTVNLPAPEVTVAAAEVTVNLPAPEVTVAAPVVNVTNEVQPAAVSVDVNLPDRRIETDFISRDDDGNLKKVVQTERTLN